MLTSSQKKHTRFVPSVSQTDIFHNIENLLVQALSVGTTGQYSYSAVIGNNKICIVVSCIAGSQSFSSGSERKVSADCH